MGWIIFIAIIAVVIYVVRKDNEKMDINDISAASLASTAPTINMNPNDPHDICYALACLVGFSGYRDREERQAMLIVNIDRTKHTTSIYANGGNWVVDHRNEAEYRKLGVPAHIAHFLSHVEFQQNPNTHALSIDFNMSAGTDYSKQRISDGLSLLPGKPHFCQLRSYNIGNDPLQICIDLTVAE